MKDNVFALSAQRSFFLALLIQLFIYLRCYQRMAKRNKLFWKHSGFVDKHKHFVNKYSRFVNKYGKFVNNNK